MVRIYVLFSAISFLFCSCATLNRPLILDSHVSPPFVLNEDILTSEPTIFVRAFSSNVDFSSGRLDSLIEEKLEKSRHRLTKRSEGAGYRILAKVLYLGPGGKIDSDSTLAAGYNKPLVSTKVDVNGDAVYSAIIDLEILEDIGQKANIYESRMVVTAQQSSPETSEVQIKEELLERAALQIAIFFK